MERILGTIYAGVSDDFQCGIYPIGRCIKAEKHDLAVVIEEWEDKEIIDNKVKIIGRMDNTIDNTFESANRVYDTNGTSPTINTCGGGNRQPMILETRKYRIRKLTPRECWRLMDFTDEDYDKAASVNSQTQLYKQAGNSIVKAVMMAIMSQLNIDGVKQWNEREENTGEVNIERIRDMR